MDQETQQQRLRYFVISCAHLFAEQKNQKPVLFKIGCDENAHIFLYTERERHADAPPSR